MFRDMIPSNWRSRFPARRREEPNQDFESAMSRVMEEFFDRSGMPVGLADWKEGRTLFRPRINVAETDEKFTVKAELPGLDEDDIEVDLEKDHLILKGEKKEESEEKTADRYYAERRFGSFRRAIWIPADVERDKVDAQFKNGVLTVTLPKSAEAKSEAKKIPIQH